MGSSTQPPSLNLKDAPLDGHRPMKVRVIGAGYSGIYLGIRIPQRLRNVDLRIYDKNDGVGGTWWVNRYPGCACDIPSHSYQYSFNPNPNWSSLYAPQREICAYIEATAVKYGVMRFVKLSHNVESCRWDDSARKWLLSIKRVDTGETFQDDADVLILARGLLSDPAWPDIPGLNKFKGELMHSAIWKEDYDFKNKRIGVIGNGSSAIQIVPSLQRVEGTQVHCFARSKTWITNPFGDTTMKKLGLDPGKMDFTPEQRQEFANNPEALYKLRKAIETDGSTIHDISIRDSAMQRMAIELFKATMKARLSKKPEIAEFLIPSFGIGCRRNTPGPGYLEALVEDNVEFITDPIESLTETGLRLKTNNGREIPLDALVCATGFQTSRAPPFPVHGRNNTPLSARFDPHPEAYLSLAVDGFPNLFFMLGPNSAIGSGSLTVMLEVEGDYIVKCLRKLQKEDYATVEVRADRVADWRAYCDEYFRGTVYTDACNSWYKSGGGEVGGVGQGEKGEKGGGGERITGLWPGSPLHALEALRAPRWEDFTWEPVDGAGGNRMRWLGNGWSVTHVPKSKKDKDGDGGKGDEGEGEGEYEGDPSWYIEPRFQNIPVPERPEEDPEFRARPFSH